MITLHMREWRVLYRAWRVQYAHLPKRLRARVVRGCVGKVGYESCAEAQAVAERLPPRDDGKQISVYPCDLCKRHHIGNTHLQPGQPNQILLDEEGSNG